MPDYTVLSAIAADRRYEPGEIITLTPKEAKELGPLGAIDPKPLKIAPAPKGEKVPPGVLPGATPSEPPSETDPAK
jgi:hypothetical protein